MVQHQTTSHQPTHLPAASPHRLACRSVEASLRSNLIIALGDLALRFPNVLEPYTGGCSDRGVGGLGAQV